ncbi:efflux transporter outer membrane subunit [Acetobacter lambici]|uniref:Efflux transporter outer membrane subunit n=1 Tax=Acetobacter lambici TaxID=1332824 RepID=A0ABT1F1L2_9PROT|nr:efflux transporter outer membrane subunit [Acetobacter lambici]MCP1242939.1 efflux transporter outer membrane subunit [Acetobacter lambici]MCP1259106.1 efflux transporter outer membrane subunit [Acetobacter lambici]NHO57492.1 efflux transporter outer membrane subunit [Acetobacter lambici]
MKNPIAFPLLLTPLLLAGCAWLAPEYKRPVMSLPATWGNTPTVVRDTSAWWQSYNDPALDQLITQALTGSDDIALAKNRLGQAQAQYNYAFANQLPMLSVTGTDAYGKFANGQVNAMGQTFHFPGKTSNFGFVGGMLNYELDLWGKNASLSNAAKAGVHAALYAQAAARLSVAAGVAQLYFSLRALEDNVALLEQSVQTQDALLALVQRQYDVGAVDAITLQQVTEQRDAVHATLPDIQDQRDRAQSALAVLVGQSPREIVQTALPHGPDIQDLNIPAPTSPLLPSSLLERRPDIAMHEQMLIASDYNIGYARAAYFPSISLASLAGVNNIDIDNLYRASSRSWTLGAAMAAPVLDFGRTESGVKLAKTGRDEQIVLYKQSIRTAFKEVRDALLAQNTALAREQGTQGRQNAAQQRLNLTDLRLRQGYASQIDVLAARASLQQAQILCVNARLQRLNASVDLYKATGGGFQTSPMPGERGKPHKKTAP